jgi:hypothetical protein
MTDNGYVEVTISETGEIESEVHGVMGPGCEELVGWIEELGDVEEHRRTPDWHRRQRRDSRRELRTRGR